MEEKDSGYLCFNEWLNSGNCRGHSRDTSQPWPDSGSSAHTESADSGGYTAVVLGAPIYMFHWHKDVLHFLSQHGKF